MSNLKFFSTNGHPEQVDFRQALLVGQAPDKGLYMPESIPQIPLDRTVYRKILTRYSSPT